ALAAQGLTPTFTNIDTRITDLILRSRWLKENYSSRIWKNTNNLANQLPKIIGGALSTGTSYEKTARLLRERFDVSRANATRLVRTETNYFHNQSELQSFIDDGIEEYEYDAEIDGRTSKICRRLNRKRYKITEAIVG